MVVGHRIRVVGAPGAGKSTLARQLAARIDGVHIELDALFHGPNWTPIPSFRADLAQAIEAHRWVVDGNYGSKVGALLFARADTVVWLDYPRRVVFPSLLTRTVRRGLTKETLWNGNRERPRNMLSANEEDNILLWTWNHFPGYTETYVGAMTDPKLAHLRFLRLRSRAEAARLLAEVGPE